MVGATELKGTLGAAGGAAGGHQVGRRGQIRRSVYPRSTGVFNYPRRSTPRGADAWNLPTRGRRLRSRRRQRLLPPVRPERRGVASARQDSDRRRQRPRGLLHWKVEMAGREIAEDVGPGPFDEPRMHFKLFPENEVPLGMVRIASADQAFHVFIPGLEHLANGQPPRLLDRSPRGHEPRLQTLCRRRRISASGAVARAVRERRSAR